MNRRIFLQSTGAAFAEPAATRPNIVILFTDDQRFDTIGALGHPEVKTPNMDRLVRSGVAFTNAHIMGGTIPAVCAPSRAMLMTGQTLFHIHDSIIAPDAAKRPKRPFDLMPETFGKNGYMTYGIGKWHNGPALYARSFKGGKNIFFGGMSDQTKVPVQSFDAAGKYSKERTQVASQHSSNLFSDAAVDFVRGRKGNTEPFFLYVAFTSPHDPRTPPPEFAAMYSPERVQMPPNFLPQHPFDNGELKVRDELLAPFPRTPDVIRRHIADYYGMISHVDAQIGRVVDILDETGQRDNTIVVFIADNGLALGQHGLMGKQNLYEHSVRVPMVIGGPGLPRGKKSDAFCYLLDLFPTLCELTGLSTPGTVEGKSLASIARGSQSKVRDSVFYAYRQFQRGVHAGDWKLIRYNAGGVRNTQLFNLKDDPHETRNLASEAKNAGRVRELSAFLKEWMQNTDDPLDLDKPDWGAAASALTA